jgi:hypothetical protein
MARDQCPAGGSQSVLKTLSSAAAEGSATMPLLVPAAVAAEKALSQAPAVWASMAGPLPVALQPGTACVTRGLK